MKELSERALDIAKIKGASYADIRLVYRKVQSIEVKNGEVEALVDRESHDALNNVELVGKETKLEHSSFSYTRVPALKLGKFNFTGVTEF